MLNNIINTKHPVCWPLYVFHALYMNSFQHKATFVGKCSNISNGLATIIVLGRIAQSVSCLTADTCMTADSVAASWILARSHTFREIDHVIISTAFLPPSSDSRRVFVGYKLKYVHQVLVNCLVELAQDKSLVR